jgi:hypothetical protein
MSKIFKGEGLMRLDDALSLKESLDNKGIILAFSGAISQPVLSGFAKGMEVRLQSIGVEMKKIRIIFEVLVEMMQNILNYSLDSKEIKDSFYESSGVVVMGYDNRIGKYFVVSGNRVEREDRERIIKRIDEVNRLSDAELRELYKSRRKSRRDSHGRGAGLGIIDLARKSTEPIEYQFEPIDETTLFFSLKVVI